MKKFITLILFSSWASHAQHHIIGHTLTRITIPGRSIVRVIGLPAHTKWHIDHPSGQLFVTTHQPFSACLLDEFNTSYDLSVTVSSTAPSCLTITPKTPPFPRKHITKFISQPKKWQGIAEQVHNPSNVAQPIHKLVTILPAPLY